MSSVGDTQKERVGSRIGMLAAIAASLLLLAVAQVGVWWPVVAHYYVATEAIDQSVVVAHRTSPTDEVLAIVADASMLTDHPLSGEAAVVAADGILRGELALPSLEALSIDPTFSPEDLTAGVPVQQLWTASLIVPDLLLRAYEHSHSRIYLDAARTYIERFCTYEARQWVPTGLLWNPHAVANRAAVLVRYWRFARTDIATSNTPTLIHRHVMRLGAMLSNPEHFVGTTNHGVMQNVALVQIATAFPALTKSPEYRDLAMNRLRKQLPFYINSEGAVLEHSAGYHFHGVVLTGFLSRLLQATGNTVPTELTSAHASSLKVLRDLQRPDSSLPLIGNTYRYAWRLPSLLSQSESAWNSERLGRKAFTRLYPVAGYAIWFDPESGADIATQTVVPWGYFDGHGHLRAQEMSLLIWADGTDWSTNTGYWPGNDLAGLLAADRWAGGNAPHRVGEALGPRQTQLLAYGEAQDVRVLDLERQVSSGSAVRRQIVQLMRGTWIVVDTHVDPLRRPLRVLWTAAPEAEVQIPPDSSDRHRFEFTRDGSDTRLTLTIAGSEQHSAQMRRGSREPFAGWVAHDRKADPAPSVDTRVPYSDASWLAAVLQLNTRGNSSNSSAVVNRFDGPDSWEISIGAGNVERRVKREGRELFVDNGASLSAHLLLEAPMPVAEVAKERGAIAKALAEIRAAFPRVRLYEHERKQVSLVLAAAWVGMIAVGWLLSRRWRHIGKSVWVALHIAWTASAAGLLFVYL